MLYQYYPEMGETISPEITTHASLGHYGKHYYVDSPLGPDVIRGVGVEYKGRYTVDADVVNLEIKVHKDSKLNGLYHYKLTCKAFEKLHQKIDIGYEMLL